MVYELSMRRLSARCLPSFQLINPIILLKPTHVTKALLYGNTRDVQKGIRFKQITVRYQSLYISTSLPVYLFSAQYHACLYWKVRFLYAFSFSMNRMFMMPIAASRWRG